jgi:acyl-coenzyme A synthetase/AMP-(fatty) acid ligase
VPTLPRNNTGKLPREALLALIQPPQDLANPSAKDAQ